MLERRAALLELVAGALDSDRPFVRVGAGARRPCGSATSRSSGRHTELTNRTLGTVTLLGPLRMDYATRSSRSVPPRRSSPASPRPTTPTTSRQGAREPPGPELRLIDGDDGARLLRSARRRARRGRGGDQERVPRLARELHPDVSDAPDAEERFAEVAEAYEVLSKPETRELYDRYGHAGLRSGGYSADHFDFGSLADLFSAFFGDDLLRRRLGRAGARRRRARHVEIELARRLPACGASVPFTGRVHVHALRRRRRRARHDRSSTCPTCGGAGRVSQVSRTVFGEFVRAHACPTCARQRPRRRDARAASASGDGRIVEERTLDVDIPAGIHDGQRIRLSGEGHAGRPGRAPGDAYVDVTVRARPATSCARATTSSRRSTLTITQAALGTTVTVPTLDGEAELRFDAGHAARRSARAARPRDAGAERVRPRRPARARQRRRPAPALGRAARAARAVRRRRRRPRPTTRTKGSSTS